MTSRGSSGSTTSATGSPATAPRSRWRRDLAHPRTGMSIVVSGGAVWAASVSSSLTMTEMSSGTLRPASLKTWIAPTPGHEARDVDRGRQVAGRSARMPRGPRRRRRPRCSRSRQSIRRGRSSPCRRIAERNPARRRRPVSRFDGPAMWAMRSVAEADEMIDRDFRAARVVHHHRAGDAVRAAVDEDDREAAAATRCTIGSRMLATRTSTPSTRPSSDQAVPAEVGAGGRPALDDDDMPAGLGGRRLDALEDFGEARIGGIGNDEADRFGRTGAQAPRDAVRRGSPCSRATCRMRSRVSALAGLRSSSRSTRETVDGSTPARRATSFSTVTFGGSGWRSMGTVLVGRFIGRRPASRIAITPIAVGRRPRAVAGTVNRGWRAGPLSAAVHRQQGTIVAVDDVAARPIYIIQSIGE